MSMNNSETNNNAPEPSPAAHDPRKPDTVDLVLADLLERKRVGRGRYGTPLQPHNGHRSLVDLYQELLDAVVYCRNLIEETKDAIIFTPVSGQDDS